MLRNLFSVLSVLIFNSAFALNHSWLTKTDISHVTTYGELAPSHRLSIDSHFEIGVNHPIQLIVAPFWHQYYQNKVDAGITIGFRSRFPSILCGTYIFGDVSNRCGFPLIQLGTGIELFLSKMEFRANLYIPFNSYNFIIKYLIGITPASYGELRFKFPINKFYLEICPIYNFTSSKKAVTATIGYHISRYFVQLIGEYSSDSKWKGQVEVGFSIFGKEKTSINKIERIKQVRYESTRYIHKPKPILDSTKSSQSATPVVPVVVPDDTIVEDKIALAEDNLKGLGEVEKPNEGKCWFSDIWEWLNSPLLESEVEPMLGSSIDFPDSAGISLAPDSDPQPDLISLESISTQTDFESSSDLQFTSDIGGTISPVSSGSEIDLDTNLESSGEIGAFDTAASSTFDIQIDQAPSPDTEISSGVSSNTDSIAGGWEGTTPFDLTPTPSADTSISILTSDWEALQSATTKD